MDNLQVSDPRKIIFMHIAKAAGSSVNNIFRELLSEEKCAFFIEWILYEKNIKDILEKYDFVSGHFYCHIIKQLQGFDNIVKFTLLREPYTHLVSHILWLDHYALPEYRDEYENINTDTQDLIKFIADIDISDPYDLDYLLVNLPPLGVQLLNNCQTRYFLDGDESYSNPISLKDIPTAIKNIGFFDICGTVENMSKVIQDVVNKSSIKTKKQNICFDKKNKKISPRNIDISNPLCRAVLQKNILADLYLYNFVLQKERNIKSV